MRWTVFFAALVLILSSMPLWLYCVAPHAVAWANAIVFALIGLAWLSIAALALRNYARLQTLPAPRVDETDAVRDRQFRHIIMVPW